VSTIVGRIRAIPSWQVTLSLALFALGFLIAAQLAAEGPRVRYASQERSSLVETVLTLQAQQEVLKSRILALRHDIGVLEAEGPASDALLKSLNADLEEARIAAGLISLQGPGLVFRLEDSGQPGAVADSLVSAKDIRIVVEELWLAGAEAVSINGERVTVSTAVLDIGGSILVNSAYLAPPYEIAAIGAPGLYGRVQASNTFVDFVHARVEAHGLQLSVAELDDVVVPAFAGTVGVQYGRPDVSPSPSP
jgi:uncharacterized protein YlxW (UPF0749 family)